MRFMGDYPLSKNQKDIDCIYFLLQVFKYYILVLFGPWKVFYFANYKGFASP